MKNMRKTTLTLLLVSVFAYTALAQTYCQPSGTVPNWAHAGSQSLHTAIIKSGETILLNYVDAASLKSYNYLQSNHKFTVSRGQMFSVEIHSGIWTWDMALGFDWDGNGVFETEYRAFSTPGIVSTKETSSWGDSEYDTDVKRKALETIYNNSRNVIRHTFNVTVPADAAIGSSFRMRVICDGDASESAPAFVFCNKISYAGSLHDFGVTVNEGVISGVDKTAEFSASKYVAYPNPVEEVLSIQLENGVYELSLQDLTGRSVRSEFVSMSSSRVYTLNVADINTGIYVLSVVREGNLVDTVRILKK